MRLIGETLKANLSKPDAIDTIKLILNHNNTNICVVVEGEDDIRLFSTLLSDNVNLIESFSGKKGVIEIVNEKSINNDRCIGIRDKDYEVEEEKRIFFSDYCCAEMMIVAIDDCFVRFCSSFSDYNNTKKCLKLRMDCLKDLQYLSKLRMFNEIILHKFAVSKNFNESCINFSAINLSSVYSDNIDEMNESIKCKIKESNKSFVYNLDYILDEVAKTPSLNSIKDLLYITNGHDFLEVLYNKIKSKNKKYKNLSLSLLGPGLRCTFFGEYFKQTLLYRKLNNYQNEFGLNILK